MHARIGSEATLGKLGNYTALQISMYTARNRNGPWRNTLDQQISDLPATAQAAELDAIRSLTERTMIIIKVTVIGHRTTKELAA